MKTGILELITHVFDELDYKALGAIYCDEGGEEFWKDRREPVRHWEYRWQRFYADA